MQAAVRTERQLSWRQIQVWSKPRIYPQANPEAASWLMTAEPGQKRCSRNTEKGQEVSGF